MSTQPPSEDPTQQYSQPQGQPPEGGGSNPWPWILGAIAIIVAGVIAAILITGGNDSSSNTDSSASTAITTVQTKTATSVPTTTQTQTTTAPININNTCNVSKVPNTVSGTSVATVVATNVPPSQKILAGCPQAASLVRGVASQQAEMPVTVEGFSCTPSVKGSYVSYKCTLNGADSALQVTTKFSLTYSS
ncbi:MAG: hypothetical protein F2813_04065 [Actinobacteria bacterium]|uniref:Unannotated protein n=1 Tax=freshwater metagenome TaxID=449393 RepID=A0A6J5ZM34_9ZZZZ|nr:hypothetical protein [Actinomycetota bacterium]